MKNMRLLMALAFGLLVNQLNAQFIKEFYKGSAQFTSFHAIVPVSDAPTSNLYVAGTYGSQLVIGELKQNGTAVWFKKLMVNDSNYIVNSMIKDSDGNLILCGGNYIGVDDNGFGFLIKFDPVLKSITWFQKTNENILFFDCTEMGAGGNYIVGGQDEGVGTGNQADHLSMVADRTTGALSVFTSLSTNVNENIDALLFNSATNTLYTTGRYELNPGGTSKFRICLDKIDSTGTVAWTKFYIKSTVATGRFYPKDIIQDGDALIIAGCGDDAGTNSVKNFYLLKTDLEGNVIWINKYDLAGTSNDGIFCSIKKHSSGYIVFGSLYNVTYTDILLMNTDFDGNINWAHSYPYRKKEGAFGMQMSSSLAVVGSTIFHVGEREMVDGTIRGILLRTSVATGDIGACDVNLDISKTSLVTPYQNTYVMSNATLSPTYTQPTPSIKNQSFTQVITCNVNGLIKEEEVVTSSEGSLKLYPNPTQDIITISFDLQENQTGFSIQIIDLTGKTVKQTNSSANSIELYVGDLPEGIYTVIVMGENGKEIIQFVKN